MTAFLAVAMTRPYPLFPSPGELRIRTAGSALYNFNIQPAMALPISSGESS
jgi:hypothetical protein